VAASIWSTFRGLLGAPAPRPEYAGLYAVSGMSNMDSIEPGVFNMTFARNGAFIHPAAGWRFAHCHLSMTTRTADTQVISMIKLFGGPYVAESEPRSSSSGPGCGGIRGSIPPHLARSSGDARRTPSGMTTSAS
jgi:hypothetical protein